MKMKATFATALGLLIGVASFAQQPPATDTTAPDIPGVVKGGTKVQVIKEGFNGTEGPIGLPDVAFMSFASCSVLASHDRTFGATRCPSAVRTTPRPVR